MKQLTLSTIIILFFPFVSIAQPDDNRNRINLWGYVVDSFRQTGLLDTKVTLMTSDSIVVDSTRTYEYDNNALYHFSLPKKTQDIILKAEREGYEPTCMAMKVRHYKRVQDVYATWINLKKKTPSLEQSLDEVVVKASKVQLVWKGDTIVYNADAFNLPQGTMLDGLIRQLPGVILKENGEILVNGRKVDYLTLNGTDFFRGDNKMMLDNLPYYTVKNIKVYDKSSDVSRFLGYDAEKKDYVMDVMLKRKYSVGLTANAEIGGGSAERWLTRAFGLGFSDHSRLTVFGNGNNINQTGRPGESGEWQEVNQVDGITKHTEANTNLYKEDRYKRWKNEFTVTFANDENDKQSRKESEYYLQGGGEFARYNQCELINNTRVGVTNTFTRDKSTSPIYFTSLVAYDYGKGWMHKQDSSSVNNNMMALYHLDDHAKGKHHVHHFSTANHILAKLPWGDHLNFRINGLYSKQDSKHLSHYLLKYTDRTLPQELRRRYEPRSFNRYYWEAEAEYVFHFPHEWNLDFGYKFHQSCDEDNTLSYRLDRDVAWMLQSPTIDDLPPIINDILIDKENSFDFVTHTKHHQLSARLYYLKNTADSYTLFELKLPLTYDYGRQHYQRGEVNTKVKRSETFLDPIISYTRQLYKKNIYFNTSFKAETVLPNIVNLVGYKSHYNPLSTTIGNPEIKPQQSYKVTGYFVKNRPQHEQTLNLYLEVSATKDKIMPSVSYNRKTGVYSRRNENVNGNYEILAGIAFGRALDKGRRWHFDNSLWFSHSNIVWRGEDFSKIESRLERITTRHIRIDDKLKLSYRANNKLNLSVHGGIVHGFSWSNLSSYNDVRITELSYSFTARCGLPFGFHLSSDLAMLHRNGYEGQGMNNHSAIWNAQLTRSIIHDRLTFSLIAHDILDCAMRNTWSISSAGNTNTWHNSLPRYFMLTISYKFHKG